MKQTNSTGYNDLFCVWPPNETGKTLPVGLFVYLSVWISRRLLKNYRQTVTKSCTFETQSSIKVRTTCYKAKSDGPSSHYANFVFTPQCIFSEETVNLFFSYLPTGRLKGIWRFSW